MSYFDVAIIGAGAAGLGAARRLMAAGKTVVVLEAGSRIGGRAWTSEDWFGVPFDIGCAWLHAADRNPFFPEAQAAGWDLYHHDMSLDHLFFGSRKASAEEMAKLRKAEAALEACLEAHDGPDDRLSSMIADCHCLRAHSTFSGPMDFGNDDDEISIEDYKAAADLEPNYFTKQGFGALVSRWGSDVPVRLNHAVRRVDWSGSGVELSGDWGWLRAGACICTASPAVLAFDEIRFTPALPADQVEALFDLPMGLLTKIPVQIPGTRLGLNAFDDLLIERNARHDIFFMSFPFDMDLMVGFVGGDFAWEIEAAGEAAAVDFATNRLADIFGSELHKHVAGGRMTNWSSDRWVRGAYAVARPGKAAARALAGRSLGDRVYFAGEHLAGALKQTCAGARLSGEDVAGQVLERLG